MKNLIFCVIISLFSTHLLAQNPRIENFDGFRTETYRFGNGVGDSVQYKLKGKTDTLLTTIFNQNGHIANILGRDSLYLFDHKGRLRVKKFGKLNELEMDSSIYYFTNGQIQLVESNIKGRLLRTLYTEEGKLVFTIYEKSTPSVSWRRFEDGNGKLLTIEKKDTIVEGNRKLIRVYDTMYYNNGQIYAVKAQEEFDIDRKVSLGGKYFNKDGSLIETEMPDSLILTPFKDNVECYYGMKNKQGDTIIRALYDNFRLVNSGKIWLAYTGDLCKIVSLDGQFLPQPTALLSNLYEINPVYLNTLQKKEPDLSAWVENSALQKHSQYFGFVEESHLYGVIDKAGKIVIAPQPLIIENQYIGEGRFFSFVEKQGDSVISMGYLDRRGKRIFPNYKYVKYSGYDDYFLIGPEIERNSFSHNQNLTQINRPLGLGRGGVEATIIEPKFNRIQYSAYLSLFFVSLKKTKKEIADKDEYVHGIYNPRTNKWLLEANEFFVENLSTVDDYTYFVVQNKKTQKYAIMDTTGKFIVPMSMSIDSIGIIDNEKGEFWVKKKNKYYFLEIKNGRANIHTTGYDYLSKVEILEIIVNSTRDVAVFFFAKKNGKWGLINPDESIVKPFEYDYVSHVFEQTIYGNVLIMVKNGQASVFNLLSLPYESPVWALTQNNNSTNKTLFSYTLEENEQSIFFINDTGKVVIPPQYEMLSEDNSGGFMLVKDAQKHKKIIFTQTGKAVDIPNKYQVAIARADSRIIVVADSLDNTYGVVSVTGKELIPCVNYSIAIADIDKSIFFVKRDTPLVQRYNNDRIEPIHVHGDSLNIEDKDWVMYDGDGKLLDAQSFRFPIEFVNGFGIGVQGENFNLYKTDGSIMTPYSQENKQSVERNFNNILRIYPNNYYAFFRNQGLVPTMILTNDSGQIIVESGRYDGISPFFDKYALVSKSGLIGLIDTFGREIVAPQDLWVSKIPIIDSLNFEGKTLHSKLESEEDFYGLIKKTPWIVNTGFYNFNKDSLKITEFQRAQLLNLILQKNISTVMNQAQDFGISRNLLRTPTSFISFDRDLPIHIVAIKKLSISENMLSLVWSDWDGSDSKFYNFKKINNRWVERNLYDILDLQGNKRWALNDLLTQKIKALSDVSIDCGSSSAFIKQVENNFMLTDKGIDFCFYSDSRYWGDANFVIISFTWDELKPFMR